MSTRIRFSSLTAILLTCAVLLVGQKASAQDDSAARLQLDVRRESTPAYADQLRLAEHSLAGPRAELAFGAVVMSGGSFITLLGVGAEAMNGEGVHPGNLYSIAGGLLTIGVGTGMLVHGIHRIHDIKVARHQLSFRGAGLAMREGGGAYVGATFGF